MLRYFIPAYECVKMAEGRIPVHHFSPGQFNCPVCLDLLKEPVTTCCGHSFCKVCINSFWDQETEKGFYSCPQCRGTFTPRPDLRKNSMLADAVEKLQAASPAHVYTGPGDAACDFCILDKHKGHDTVSLSAERTEKQLHQMFPSEPKSREDLLKYFRYLTLDPNTAHNLIILSEKNRAASSSRSLHPYSDHPERFDFYYQVLCKESVCGRCYWEVEWSCHAAVSISLSYKVIGRKGRGKECEFGCNNQSWSLCCSSSSVSFYHNDIKTNLKASSASRIGVHVDHSAGSLSFYSVSDTTRLLHRVCTTFTQPLYAGFGVYGGTVRLCDAK